MKLTESFAKIISMRERVKPIQGGTSASKTYSILQQWILNAIHQNYKFKGINSIVSESMPHLKRGAMRDFFEILKGEGLYDENNHNKTNFTYTIGESVFEFFGVDQADRLRGARRKNLFINEANNVSKDAYDELEIRTRHNVWLDWNPTFDFWGMHLGVEPIILTYKDNQYLSDEIVKSIESREGNEQWFRVYGLGLVGSLEGTVYKNWKVIDKIPKEAELLGSGLDWGFSNDYTAVVNLYRFEGELLLKEVLFDKGLTNKQIAERLKGKEIGVLYCDAAEPKSIKELNNEGIRALPAKKGKDSVLYGIQLLQDYKLRPTKDSLNLITAFRNYQWLKDRTTGEYMNKPNHNFSDILDAVRYGAVMTLGKNIGIYNIR